MPTPLDPRFRIVLEAVATAAVDYGHSDTSSADVLERLLEVVDAAFPGVTWGSTAARIREALAACPTVSPVNSPSRPSPAP